MELSRRSFLQGAAATGAALAATGILSSKAFAEEATEEEAVAEEATEEEAAAEGEEATEEAATEEAAEGEEAAAEGEGGGMGGGTTVEAFVSSATDDGRVRGYAGPGDWLGTAPELTADSTVDVDVVVVGAGHAGTQAALSLAQNGCTNVVVLEAQDASIFDWYGEDCAAFNCDLALEHGICEHDLGAITNEFVTRAGGRCNPDIIRSFVQNSGPMMNNMIEVAKTVCADKETYAALDGVAGTVLETNVLALEDIMLEYDNTEEGQLFVQTQMDPDAIVSGADVYECENLTNYPIVTGTKYWAATVCFAGVYNSEPISGVAANSTIRNVQSACLAYAVSLGVQVVFGATAEVLVQNDDGDVTGVIASVDDSYVQYNASKAVILAAGDYCGNAEMCYALLTEYMEENERLGGEADSFYSMMGGRDGSGVKMGCWAGGFIDPAPRGAMILGGGVSSPWGTNSGLWLNSKGKRWCNEGNTMATSRATYLQQSGVAVMLCDANWVYSCCGSGLEHGGPDFGRPQFFADLQEGMESDPDENGQISILTGTIMERGTATMYKADTLEELLTLCGYDEDTIPTCLESIEHYNEMCAAGVDSDYGKGEIALNPIETAPFYASVGSISLSAPTPSMVTMSGLMTDENQQVLRNDNSLIGGLYTAGNNMGGRYGLGYNCPCAGNSIGMATTNGYTVGQVVAAL